jgi:hypothetical protein
VSPVLTEVSASTLAPIRQRYRTDHAQDAVVGCKVQRCPSILGREKKTVTEFFSPLWPVTPFGSGWLRKRAGGQLRFQETGCTGSKEEAPSPTEAGQAGMTCHLLCS